MIVSNFNKTYTKKFFATTYLLKKLSLSNFVDACLFSIFFSSLIDNTHESLATSRRSCLSSSLKRPEIVMIEMGLSQVDAVRRLNIFHSVVQQLWNQATSEE